AVGIELEHRSQIERAQARVVGLHPAQIPVLPADLIQAVGRISALEDQVQRMIRIVGHAKLILLQRDLADDDDGTAVVVAGIREERRDVRGAARLRLRVGNGRTGCKRNRKGRTSSHITFFCAALASIAASDAKSNALATYPLVPS